jgi:hypothetical protein
MANHACFIFFSGGPYSLDSAAQVLAERGLTVKRRSDELEVGFPGKPVLRVSLSTDAYVRGEAEELSEGTPYSSEMSKCIGRFEILIDDLDAVLAEINTLIDVQVAIQQLTRGFLYSTWNGDISGPDSPVGD